MNNINDETRMVVVVAVEVVAKTVKTPWTDQGYPSGGD